MVFAVHGRSADGKPGRPGTTRGGSKGKRRDRWMERRGRKETSMDPTGIESGNTTSCRGDGGGRERRRTREQDRERQETHGSGEVEEEEQGRKKGRGGRPRRRLGQERRCRG